MILKEWLVLVNEDSCNVAIVYLLPAHSLKSVIPEEATFLASAAIDFWSSPYFEFTPSDEAAYLNSRLSSSPSAPWLLQVGISVESLTQHDGWS